MEMDDRVIKRMITQGYIEVAGVNAVGDEIYKFTQKFYDERPEIIEFIRTTESDLMSSLWFKGFVELKMDDEGSMYIYLTEKSDKWYDTEELTEDEKAMMYIIYSTGNFYDIKRKDRR